MDICRTLLSIGLVVLLWNLRFRGIQPVRDFVIWGILYPFHFVLMVLLILVIWGVIGAEFGLQGLFLQDNALTQILVGGTVMLLFSALILHYAVLDSPGRWWSTSLKTLVQVLKDLNGVMPPEYPLQRLLRNGFLERFDRGDLEVLNDVIQRDPVFQSASVREDGSERTELEEMLRDEPFRLLVSPAILFTKSVMLVLLVGAVPAIVVPVLNRDPLLFVERLPWLAGVILGNVFGIVLACRTTRWAADAAGWRSFQDRLMQAIRASASSTEQITSALRGTGRDFGAQGGSADRVAAHGNSPAPNSSDPGQTARPWLSLLFVFFVIHFFVNVVLPDRLTTRWIDWQERTYIEVPANAVAPYSVPDRWASIPWLPIRVLLAEAAGALGIMGVLRLLRGGRIERAAVAFLGRCNGILESVLRIAVGKLSTRVGRWILVAGLATFVAVSIAGPALSSPALMLSLWEGIWGFAFLGTVLAFWLVGFWLATRAGYPNGNPGKGTPIVAVAVLVTLVLFYFSGAGQRLVGLLAVIAAIAGVARIVKMTDRIGRVGIGARPATVVILILASIATFIAGWWRSDYALPTALWLGLAILVLGALAMANAGRRRPTLLYPLTLILAFIAFATPYNALGDSWQARMPAAGSIACVVGLVAAIYTMISFFRPRSSLLAASAMVAGVFLLNGNAWFVDPNEFKATFPKMESYYALPIGLNSRDYFRDTTPSTVRLRSRTVTSDFDRLEKQNETERLATAYFGSVNQQPSPRGGHKLYLSVEDPAAGFAPAKMTRFGLLRKSGTPPRSTATIALSWPRNRSIARSIVSSATRSFTWSAMGSFGAGNITWCRRRKHRQGSVPAAIPKRR